MKLPEVFQTVRVRLESSGSLTPRTDEVLREVERETDKLYAAGEVLAVAEAAVTLAVGGDLDTIDAAGLALAEYDAMAQ